MKKVMSERMQQLLRDPEATRRLRVFLQSGSTPEAQVPEKFTFTNAAGQKIEVSPRFVNVG